MFNSWFITPGTMKELPTLWCLSFTKIFGLYISYSTITIIGKNGKFLLTIQRN